ncbi:golgin subfamily A member 5-like [Anoplophora glabripennis]|uniref:golgin subfamily A member 5-like n=1 Tax=Anoplophora glabripennis TaxID=217634 RepID=UPI0008735E21|nr:golgin subfamily A member 5-like [Anoplophora glabripennis]
MVKINNDLLQKHKELEKELHEKELLLKKLKKLENQKTLLSREMEDLQVLLQEYCDSEQYSDEEREAIANLQKQVEQQKQEWESQKENLANEKELAIRAAKFATQKLLDTVSDFQKQVDTQKKVQNMLTKMLHDKEEELKIVKSKIFSINSITSDLEVDVPVNEIFKRNNGISLSNPATTSSFHTSYSNGSRCVLKQNYEEPDINPKILKQSDELPV